jgi:hypothetical protein
MTEARQVWKFRYMLPLIFLIVSCQCQKNDSHKIINDIKADFKIEFLNDSAFPIAFLDNEAKQEFIQNCKKFIPEKELTLLLNKKVKPFGWDKSQITGVKLISFDSLLKINSETEKQNYLYIISVPIFNDTKEYAVVRIFQQLPDDFVVYGAVCIYLFRHSNNKWIEIARENCTNY